MMARWSRGRRWWWAAGVLLIALASGWAGSRWLADPWPPKLRFPTSLETHPIGFASDGRTFLTSEPGEITLWNCSTGRKQATWPTPYGVAVEGDFAPDGRTFAAVVRQYPQPAQVALIDVATGQTKATVMTHYDRSGGLRYTDDGSAVQLNSDDQTGLREMLTLNPNTLEIVSVIDPKPQPGLLFARSPNQHYFIHFDLKGGPITLGRTDLGPDQPLIQPTGLNSARITGEFGFADDDRTLAVARIDGTVELWDMTQGRLTRVIQAHRGWEKEAGYASMRACFSPDGEKLFSWGGYGHGHGGILSFLTELIHQIPGSQPSPSEVVIFDLKRNKRLIRSTEVDYVFFSPDGRSVVTRDRDKKFSLRDLPGR